VYLLGSPLFLLSPHVLVWADGPAERTLTLSDQIHFTGEVRKVFMVVAAGEKVLESKQVAWIDQPDKKEVTGIGQVALQQHERVLQVLFVVFGEQGEVRSSFKTIAVDEIPPTWMLSSGELRDRLIERRGSLRQLQSEVNSQDERLRNLQEDADAIANVAKIVSVEDELKDVQAKIRKVDAAFTSIQHRSAQMRARPSPLNAQKREAELVRQLGALSTALTATETSALKGINTASADLQRKLRMIEDASDDHVVLLEEELAELQRRQR
jgi:DNA uptake protein ComE-like DNA-binding protein